MGGVGTFYTTIEVESVARRGERRVVERAVGIVHVMGRFAPDWIVFAEPGDMLILGAHLLEGLNLRVDSRRKRLIPGGPILAGAAA